MALFVILRREKSRPKNGPRRPQEGPQEGPKSQTSCMFSTILSVCCTFVFPVFRASKTAQQAPKIAPRRRKRASRGPQDGSKMSKRAPRGLYDRGWLGPPRPTPEGARAFWYRTLPSGGSRRLVGGGMFSYFLPPLPLHQVRHRTKVLAYGGGVRQRASQCYKSL